MRFMTAVRNIISLLTALEMIISSLLSGGPALKYEKPEPGAGEYSRYVDVFTGTGGIPWSCGMLSPAASAPFGCVRLGPDTSAVNGLYLFKTNTSGYYYEHQHILGFSYGRLSGTGIRDYGMFRVTPGAGKIRNAIAFSHDNEYAEPGYYSVYLPGTALAEMTATSHTGYQRYTFSSGKDALLKIDAASFLTSSSTENAEISYDPAEKTIKAYVDMRGGFSDRSGGLPAYYYAEIDREPVSCETENGSVLYLNFGNIKDGQVTLRAGISFISYENARDNLYEEAGGMGFDEVRKASSDLWEEKLSSIEIEADEDVKRIFYTSLYHAMIMPTDFTDSNGDYLGFDKQVHKAEGYTYRSDMSLWDTARDTHSLYTLIAPEVQNDCLQSLLCMAEQGGVLPRWPMGAGYTSSMFGNPANLVFTESYLKGMQGVDYEKALEYMMKSAVSFDNKENREFGDLYSEYGYVPDDLVKDDSRGYSVSRTIEYSWEDSAAAVLAGKLGNTQAERLFSESADNYLNVWDDSSKYFRARNSDGSWGKLTPNLTAFYDDILGTSFSDAYCEGGARHWRWNVLQDIEGMIELFGSKEYFVSELEDFMKDTSGKTGAVNPGPGFWIGNQHDIHTPYLFSDAGRADLTQKWVRWTLKNRFSTGADGLDGNDDGGTLSAWYVFSSMGFYPLAGSDKYWIGSPCIDSAKIRLPGGAVLEIEAQNQSESAVYVESVELNGEKLDGVYLTHDMISSGGRLVFVMTDGK